MKNSRKTILHIVNDFSGSAVYKNLFSELDKIGYCQIIYTAIKDSKLINRNLIQFEVPGSKIIYSKILNKHYDRILYRQKISKVMSDIEKSLNLSSIDLIHAHTWYSDGGVAYKLNTKYNIPYLLAIRSSDIAFFYKYLLLDRVFGRKILKFASNIIFISASYKTKHEKLMNPNLLDKVKLIPNGIEDFWLDNNREKTKNIPPEIKVLYVGQFIPRKNIKELILAIEILRRKNFNIELNLVGDCHKMKFDEVEKLNIKFLGKITDRRQLINIFRNNHIFAMPSCNETFGLVYIEALSQGLPILYTKDDGIDGFYENIGEAVVKHITPIKIADELEKLILNYARYEIDLKTINQFHRWSSIAITYSNVYNKILNC